MNRTRAPAKQRSLSLLAALVLFAWTGCRSPRARSETPFRAELETRTRELEDHFRTGNLLGVADIYADDAVLVNARGERTRGRDEIDAYWSAIEDPVEWRLENRTVRGSEAVAYAVGTSTLRVRREGRVVTTTTDFLLVWRHDPDGQWRIELDAYWPKTAR